VAFLRREYGRNVFLKKPREEDDEELSSRRDALIENGSSKELIHTSLVIALLLPQDGCMVCLLGFALHPYSLAYRIDLGKMDVVEMDGQLGSGKALGKLAPQGLLAVLDYSFLYRPWKKTMSISIIDKGGYSEMAHLKELIRAEAHLRSSSSSYR
jgi:hypothetical protein